MTPGYLWSSRVILAFRKANPRGVEERACPSAFFYAEQYRLHPPTHFSPRSQSKSGACAYRCLLFALPLSVHRTVPSLLLIPPPTARQVLPAVCLSGKHDSLTYFRLPLASPDPPPCLVPAILADSPPAGSQTGFTQSAMEEGSDGIRRRTRPLIRFPWLLSRPGPCPSPFSVFLHASAFGAPLQNPVFATATAA